jgi:hypothetical protein
MKFMKSILMGTGAVVLAGLILTLLAPRAAHAIVATAVSVVNTPPVTVVNTTANPGSVLDADKATRIPYQSSIVQNCGVGVTRCQFNFTAAPSGYRLVVENVSAGLVLNGGAAAPVVSLSNPAGGSWTFTGVVGQIFDTPSGGFNQSVLAYFDPADGQPIVALSANFTSVPGFSQTVTLSGYLQDCTVLACPTIQR